MRPSSTSANGLRPFEVQLLDGIAAPGGQVKVSELPSKVHESDRWRTVALYDEVVNNGWYEGGRTPPGAAGPSLR